MNTFLKWFYRIWIGLVILLNVMGIAGVAMTTQSFTETISFIQETYSPFNIINWIFNLVLLLPAIGAYYWLGKRTNNL